jgi:hypothetical protein
VRGVRRSRRALIMNTAVEDGKIRRNPCRIKGAAQEYSQERPVVPVGTLYQAAR